MNNELFSKVYLTEKVLLKTIIQQVLGHVCLVLGVCSRVADSIICVDGATLSMVTLLPGDLELKDLAPSLSVQTVSLWVVTEEVKQILLSVSCCQTVASSRYIRSSLTSTMLDHFFPQRPARIKKITITSLWHGGPGQEAALPCLRWASWIFNEAETRGDAWLNDFPQASRRQKLKLIWLTYSVCCQLFVPKIWRSTDHL